MFKRCLRNVASSLRVAAEQRSCVDYASTNIPLSHRSAHSTRPMASPVKVGIVGCGRIGQFHARTVAASNIGRLVWIADANEHPTSSLSRELHAQFLPSTKVESAVLASPRDPIHVDAIIICAPTPFHTSYTHLCLDAQKPVFCEKPLATDLDQLKETILKAKELRIALTIGYQRVYDRDIRKLIETVQEHAQRTNTAPWSISMRSYDSPTASDDYLRTCGSVFLDAMCHDAHVASSLLSIDAVIQSAVAMEVPFSDSALGARTAAAIFRTEDNTAITSEFHRVSQIGYDNTIDVTFPDRMFRLSSRPRWTITEGSGKGYRMTADYDEGFLSKYADAYRTEILEFLESVSMGAVINHEHLDVCMRAMQMIQLAIDASKSGREAFLERL